MAFSRNDNALPLGWSVAMTKNHDQKNVYHLSIIDPDQSQCRNACGGKGTTSGRIENTFDLNHRCRQCVRTAIGIFKRIDKWKAEQCQECMRRLNSETKDFAEIFDNLEFYREHCRHLVKGHTGLTDEDLN